MRMQWKMWQVREGGPLVPAGQRHPWYVRAWWRGPNGMRGICLRHNPICQRCHHDPSTVVDHIKTWITPEGIISWKLFSDPTNHRALCAPCHNQLTALYDGGFGNPKKAGKENHVEATGTSGRQFSSSTLSVPQLDKALGTKEEMDELLKGIPE